MQLLCRNRVRDLDTWKAVLDDHRETAHEEAGLRLVKLWRVADDPGNVFLFFDVVSRERAEAFMEALRRPRPDESPG